jgi:hypothetical protein
MNLVAIPTDLYYHEMGIKRRLMLYVTKDSIKYRILQAIKEGNHEEFISCYNEMSNIDREDTYPLTQAARYNREDIFLFLYEQGYRANERCEYYAKRSGNKVIMSYIS